MEGAANLASAVGTGVIDYEVAKNVNKSPWARNYLEFQMIARYILAFLIVGIFIAVIVFMYKHPNNIHKESSKHTTKPTKKE